MKWIALVLILAGIVAMVGSGRIKSRGDDWIKQVLAFFGGAALVVVGLVVFAILFFKGL